MKSNFTWNIKTRIKIVAGLCLLPPLAVILQLFYLQTFKHDKYAGRVERTIYTELAEDRIRGRILDVNGEIMAESVRTYSAALLKKYVRDKEAVFDALNAALGMSKAEIRSKWNKEGNFFYAAKKIKPLEYAALTKEIKEKRLSGIELTPEYDRVRPYGVLAADLIGSSNSKNLGLSGLEQLYNDVLSQDISKKRVKRARGQIIYERDLYDESKVSDVYLTIDAASQYHVSDVLKKYVEANGAERGMAIVQDPHTGYIVAAASYPVIGGQSMPFQFTYEPGSTFKAVTSSAGIDSGLFTPETVMEFEDKARFEVAPRFTVRDKNSKEKLTVTEMMETSSNRGAAKMALELGAKDFFYYIRAYGFGAKTDVGFQGESSGVLRPHTKWNRVETATAGYGYGISLTGMQLIGAYSAIANGGYLMKAHVVSKIVGANGKTGYKAKPVRIRRVLKPETAALMNGVLQRVVTNGSGKKARVEGYLTAGKTGTAEKSAAGGYEKSSHIVSFAGFFPADKPQFTVLFVLDNPAKPIFGGESAAPAFSEIASRLINIHGVRK